MAHNLDQRKNSHETIFVMPATFGIIGASGFVGLRATEILSRDPNWRIVPIVRAASSLAVLARDSTEWRIADLLSSTKLAVALENCSVCLHAAIGDASQIVRMAETTYRACVLAGVKRLIWLSSSSVHGQNPVLGTDEETQLHDKHPIIYNNAKVRAEWTLERMARDGAVEIVLIRPSVVFGPRSRWVGDALEAFRTGGVACIDEGRGLCNSVYIDNLVEIIRLAAVKPQAKGQAFLVGDEEAVTWRNFLLPIALHLDLNENALVSVSPPVCVFERESVLDAFTLHPIYTTTCARIPSRVKRLIKGIAVSWRRPSPEVGSWIIREKRLPKITLEMALLQQCKWRLSSKKAIEILGYSPPISFSEGMRRSLAWLEFLQ